MKNSKKLLNILKFLIVIFGISIFAIYPYLNNRIFYAHDLPYHLNRILSITENIKNGDFLSLIHSRVLNNLGYANGLFYPQIFMYIPAILMAITGIHVLTVYKMFLIIITFFTFLAMYYSVKNIFGKKSIAFLSGLLYTFSLYRLTDIYVRGALGELLSFIFIPIIIYGLYEIIFAENEKWWITVFGICGLAYSHLLSFVLIIPFILIICLLNIDKIFKDKKKLKNLILAAVFSILITIAFFGPMLEQKVTYRFNIDNNTVDSPEELKNRANSLSMTLNSKVIGGYATNSSEDAGCMSEGIGIILIIFAGAFILRNGLNYKENRFEIQLYIIGLVTLFMTTKLFPWDKLNYINIIQFPFRLNIFSTVVFSIIGANTIYEIFGRKDEFVKLICVMVLIFNSYILGETNINFNSVRFFTYEGLVEGVDQEIASKEYLPEETSLEDLTDCTLYNINNKEEKIDFNQIGNKIEFEYKASEYDMQLNIPLIYYKGYSAKIEKENGEIEKLEVSKNEENGFVLVKGNKELSGKITVKYSLTVIQIISYIISGISFILLILLITYKNLKKRENNK